MRWLSAALVALLLGGCGEADDAEARLRGAIADAERAVEERALQRVTAILSPEYQDLRGRDYRTVRALLLGYLQRHRNIHLFTRITELELDAEGKRANVRLYAAMTAAPVQAVETLASLHADLHRFDLQFIDGDDGWQLLRADWRRAALSELLP
jgi:hypothetical protein